MIVMVKFETNPLDNLFYIGKNGITNDPKLSKRYFDIDDVLKDIHDLFDSGISPIAQIRIIMRNFEQEIRDK